MVFIVLDLVKFNTGNSLWFATEFFLNSSPCQDCHPDLIEGGGGGENPFSSLGRRLG